MKLSNLEIKNIIMYQVGALKSFLDEQGIQLNHIKPHGALYGMASKDEEVARAIADAVAVFQVSVFGMVNTCHEKVYKERGVKFYGEFYRRNGSKLRLRLGRNKQKSSLLFSAILLRICSLYADYY